MRGKSIFFVLPDAFLVRSYLSTPIFDRLLQLRDETGLKLVFITPTQTIRPFLESHGCEFEPLKPTRMSWRERLAFNFRVSVTHRMAVYRFNDIHQFKKHQRKQKISSQMRKEYGDAVIRRDAAPWYFGFPFGKSQTALNAIHKLNYSFALAANDAVDSYFEKHQPVLMLSGSVQIPTVASYVYSAQQRGVPMIGGVGSWDHPTMDGPMAGGVREYWVWNGIMEEELVRYHRVAPEDIKITGTPQFDAYATLNLEEAGRKARERLGISPDATLLSYAAYSPRLGFGEPSVAGHIARQIEAGVYGESPIEFLIRSHPADQQFEARFAHLSKYPFVHLYRTPLVRRIEPEAYRQDTEFLGGMLATSDVLLCGPGTVAIDAACFDTPVVNVRFDGDVELPEPISARSHFAGDHYQKLLATKGTRVVDSFDELDTAIRLYLSEPSIDADGRAAIRREFAGWTDESLAADRILERIRELLGIEARQEMPQLAQQR